MSGHSKWHQIRRQKGATDQARGKIFARHSKLIEVAARHGGGDPGMNAILRMAIENARADNMPKENIERAIQKGTGEDKSGAALQEVMYEGFGPGGIALLISVVTDNKNRSASSVRNALAKYGGNMGGAGTTSWMFVQKGLIHIPLQNEDGAKIADHETIELAAIDAGAEDIREEGDSVEVVTESGKLGAVKQALHAQNIPFTSARLEFLPKETVKIEDISHAKKILAIMAALEDDEDVTGVASNFDISGELMEKIQTV